MADYQPLVNNSQIACETFLEKSLVALQYQMLAIKIAQTKGLQNAMRPISKCSDLAKEMAVESGKLVNQSQKLWNSAKEAVDAAAQDETISYTERKNLEKNLTDIKAKEAMMKATKTALDNEINEQREREEIASKKADKQQQRAFVLSVVSTFMKPLQVAETVGKLVTRVIGDKDNVEKDTSKQKFKVDIEKVQEENAKNVADLIKLEEELAIKKVQLSNKKNDNVGIEQINKLAEEIAALETRIKISREAIHKNENKFKTIIDQLNVQADNYLQQEAQAIKTLIKLQNLRREADANLAESVVKLQHLNAEKDELGQAIKSLELTISTLGKVMATFEDTRAFWKGIERKCKALTDVDVFQMRLDEDQEEDFKMALQGAAMGWFSLSKINLEARDAIENVVKSTSNIIRDLPTKEEANRLVQPLSIDILSKMK